MPSRAPAPSSVAAIVLAALASFTLLVSVAAADPGTAFTYQGELSAAGEPVSGPHAISFTLWDAETAGTQVAGPVAFPAVPVADGRFAVDLDFGLEPLGDGPRWLEITVEGFVLSPRQPLRPSPYSIRTRGIDVDEDGDVGIGVSAGVARLRVWTPAGSTQPGLEVFAPDGGSIQAINQNVGNPTIFARNQAVGGTAGYLASGPHVVEIAGPTAGVKANTTDPANDWAGWFNGRMFLGTRSFVGRTESITGAEYFGVRAPVTSGYGGMYVSTDGPGTLPFYGYAPDGVPRAWTTFEAAQDRWRLFIDGVTRLEVDADGLRVPGAPGMPVAMANVDEDGVVEGGSGGIQVSKFDDGFQVFYDVSVPGLTLSPSSAVLLITPRDPDGWRQFVSYNAGGGARIRLQNSGTDFGIAGAFSVVIWEL